MTSIESLISNYLKDKNNHNYKSLFVNEFKNLKSDEEKVTNLKLILEKLKKTYIFTLIMPELLQTKFDEQDNLKKIIHDYNLVDYYLKNYQQIKKMVFKKYINEIEFSYIDSYMHVITIFKQMCDKGSYITVNSKQLSKLVNLDLDFNQLFRHYYNNQSLTNITSSGFAYYFNKIINNVDDILSSNEKDLINFYLNNINITSKEILSNNVLIKFIMNSNSKNKFIKEMQSLIKEKHSTLFNQIDASQEQLKMKLKTSNYNLNDINLFSKNAILSNDIMNINLAHTLIKDHLEGKIILNENIITNAIKSIGMDYLRCNGIYNYAFLIKKNHQMSDSCLGYHSKIHRIIVLNSQLIDNFIKNKDIKLFDTLFHELSHACEINKLDGYNDYRMQKEIIIENYYPTYYDKSYKYQYTEISARSKGAIETFRYISRLVPSLTKKYIEEYKKQVEDENINLNKRKTLYKPSPNYIYKKDEHIDDIFIKLVKKNPKIIRRNPIFKLEFDYKGNKKSLVEMCNIYDKLTIKEKDIFSSILKTRLQGDFSHKLSELESAIDIKNANARTLYVNMILEEILTSFYIQCYKDEISSFILKHKDNLKYKIIIEEFNKRIEERTYKEVSKRR